MTTKKSRQAQKKYTLAEIKDKYFPNRELSSLTNRDDGILARDAFVKMLKEVATPVKKQGKKG